LASEFLFATKKEISVRDRISIMQLNENGCDDVELDDMSEGNGHIHEVMKRLVLH
jgi:hypothetical protein